jgi:hypothetical protein
LTASAAGGALTAGAGTLVFHTASGSCGVAMVCASSGDCQSEGLASCSAVEGSGDAVLGDPVESGEEAMLL